MFLKNQWYAAALSSELEAGRPVGRMICGEPVVMFRTESGALAALEDRCPHRYAPLSLGECIGESIACSYHGIRFGPTGECTLIPQQSTIPTLMRVKAYPLVERWGWAWIWLGDASSADPASIPNYWWFEAEGWKSFYRLFRLKANYELCADNLLDLSHTPFLHKTSVGVPEMVTAPVETRVEGDTVYQHRVMENVKPSPFVAEWGQFKGRINRRATVTWVPAANISAEMIYEDADTSITVMLTNPLTPETEKSTHVWFAWSRNFGSDDANDPMSQSFEAQSLQILQEDLSLMEFQQENVDRAEAFRPAIISSDATLVQARRVLDRLRKQELSA